MMGGGAQGAPLAPAPPAMSGGSQSYIRTVAAADASFVGAVVALPRTAKVLGVRVAATVGAVLRVTPNAGADVYDIPVTPNQSGPQVFSLAAVLPGAVPSLSISSQLTGAGTLLVSVIYGA